MDDDFYHELRLRGQHMKWTTDRTERQPGPRRTETGQHVEPHADPATLQREQLDSGLNFLFLAAFPLLLWVFHASFAGIATAIGLIWVLSLALRLISVGQKLHYDYEQSVVARAPRIPRKLIGSLLIGLVVLVLAGHKYDSLWVPMIAGILGVVLSLGAFGLDPRRDKGAERERQMAELAAAEDAMALLADRVAAMGDPALTLKIEEARRLVLRPMRQCTDDPKTCRRLAKPVHKLIALLSTEINRMERDWAGQGKPFARKRFVAKLEVMIESYEAFAVHSGVRGARDSFEREADLLIDRMPQDSAA